MFSPGILDGTVSRDGTAYYWSGLWWALEDEDYLNDETLLARGHGRR